MSEKKLKDAQWLMHEEACYKSSMQRVRAFSYGYNLPTLVREHVTRKRPLSRTPVRHWQPVPSSCAGHLSSSSLLLLQNSCRMRNALRGHDPYTEGRPSRWWSSQQFQNCHSGQTRGSRSAEGSEFGRLRIFASLDPSPRLFFVISLAQQVFPFS